MPSPVAPGSSGDSTFTAAHACASAPAARSGCRGRRRTDTRRPARPAALAAAVVARHHLHESSARSLRAIPARALRPAEDDLPSRAQRRRVGARRGDAARPRRLLWRRGATRDTLARRVKRRAPPASSSTKRTSPCGAAIRRGRGRSLPRAARVREVGRSRDEAHCSRAADARDQPVLLAVCRASRARRVARRAGRGRAPPRPPGTIVESRARQMRSAHVRAPPHAQNPGSSSARVPTGRTGGRRRADPRTRDGTPRRRPRRRGRRGTTRGARRRGCARRARAARGRLRGRRGGGRRDGGGKRRSRRGIFGARSKRYRLEKPNAATATPRRTRGEKGGAGTRRRAREARTARNASAARRRVRRVMRRGGVWSTRASD